MTLTATPTETPVVYDVWVPVAEVAAWRGKVEKANKRADRVGLGTPYSIDTTERRERKVKNEITGYSATIHEARVIVTGETPSLPGWSMVATVAWGQSKPVINTVPGYTGPMIPTPADQTCAHCRKIRSRKDTYLVRGPEGQIEQVGRNCLADYTGIPVGWVASLTEWDKGDESWGGLGHADPVYDTRSLLKTTVAVVDAVGYVSRSSYSGTPTSADVALVWHGATHKAARERLAEIEARMADTLRTEAEVDAEVDALLAWIAAETPTSNYIQNLQNILADEWVTARSLGYAVSAVQAHRKHLGQVAERKVREAAKAEAKDVPTGRVVIEGTVTSTRTQSSDWGTTLKMRVVSPEGWSVYGTVPRDIETRWDEAQDRWVEIGEGDVVRFTATVEASRDDSTHGWYKRPTKAEIVQRAEEEV